MCSWSREERQKSLLSFNSEQSHSSIVMHVCEVVWDLPDTHVCIICPGHRSCEEMYQALSHLTVLQVTGSWARAWKRGYILMKWVINEHTLNTSQARVISQEQLKEEHGILYLFQWVMTSKLRTWAVENTPHLSFCTYVLYACDQFSICSLSTWIHKT